MKEFTPEQIEAMKHFPRTLPEDRRRFCELFLAPPSRQDVLEAQKREAIERRKQQIRAKGHQQMKQIVANPELLNNFVKTSISR